MNEDEYHDILLKEYAEAATLCRSYEQLTTRWPTLFMPFATALAGLLVSVNLNAPTKFLLSIAGLVSLLCLVNNVYRLQAYYLCYLKRIKDIEGLVKREGQPVMSLYTGRASATTGSHTISYELAIAAVFWLFIVFFAVFAGVTVVGEGAIFEAPDTVSGGGTVVLQGSAR